MWTDVCVCVCVWPLPRCTRPNAWRWLRLCDGERLLRRPGGAVKVITVKRAALCVHAGAQPCAVAV